MSRRCEAKERLEEQGCLLSGSVESRSNIAVATIFLSPFNVRLTTLTLLCSSQEMRDATTDQIVEYTTPEAPEDDYGSDDQQTSTTASKPHSDASRPNAA